MHIGFDISQTGSNKAGCGFYAHALARTLVDNAADRRFTFYPSFGDFFFDRRMPLRNPYDAPCSNYGPRHLTRESAANFWNSDGLEAALGNPDLIHANNFWCPLQLQRSRLVYTLYDLAFLVEPAWTTEANRIGCFDGVFRAAMAADWIVAISAASREHFLRVFPHFPPTRIRVIHPCSRFVDPDPQALRPASLREIQAGAFWLCVGTIEPRKNQRLLAQAYADYLLRGGAPMPLVLAGGNGWLMEDFSEYLERLGIDSKVILTGYVSDAELVWLYRNCFANLYPSLFEGFGLPVLEGMQFGAASLVSNSSSLPEAAGDAAWLLPPDDSHAWTDAMLRLTTGGGSRELLAQRAMRQAERFDWHGSSKALLDLYDEALATPRRNA